MLGSSRGAKRSVVGCAPTRSATRAAFCPDREEIQRTRARGPSAFHPAACVWPIKPAPRMATSIMRLPSRQTEAAKVRVGPAHGCGDLRERRPGLALELQLDRVGACVVCAAKDLQHARKVDRP